MKTEAEQVMNTAEVWAETVPTAKTKLPGIQVLVLVASVIFLLAVAASLSVYLSGLHDIRAAAAQIRDSGAKSPNAINQLVTQSEHWAQTLTFAALASGLGLFTVAIIGVRVARQRWVNRHVQSAEEADARAQRLLAKLADAKVTVEEARSAQQIYQTQAAAISQKNAALEKELERHRQMEKTLTQQTNKLERSKDVLELHVQARTEELQKLQKRYELLLNSAGEGICGFDMQGRATFINPAAARLTGGKIQDMIGRTEDAIFFPAKTAGTKDAPGLLKNANGEFLPEQLIYRKDGSCFSAEYMRTPLLENDKVVGTVVMFKDITERRLAEDKLNHKAEELARSNRELEQFAFVASHDLQEPLRKIQAFGDRLKTKCEAVQLDEGRDYLERMQNAAARMQTLINDLLTFSRVLSSQQPFVAVDLGTIAREVLVDLECSVEKSGGQVQLNELPTIEADSTQVRQLLQNLIGNALKFQAEGAKPQIKIDAQILTREQLRETYTLPKASPSSTPEDKFCVLSVQDNGIGFDEQYLDKVFAVFQRLHGRSEFEGTGVGLAVCRRITDRHGGLITAKSKPGEGSTFIVVLPLLQPKVEATQ